MNDIEARLRDAYRAAAATISPDTTRELGEQAVTISPAARPPSWRRRGRIIIPLAAAAAVAVTAALLPGVLASGHRPGTPAAAGPIPRFAAQLDSKHPSDFGFLIIRNLVTGAKVARIAAPARGLLFYAVATSDGTHFVAALDRDGRCGTRFYQFQLNGAGQPSALTPFKLAFVRRSVATIALSHDNKTFAYLGQVCANSPGAHAWLTVVNLPSMRASRWAMSPGTADAIMPLQLTANGGLLAYGIIGGWRDQTAVFLLPTNAAPGPALQRSRMVAKASQFGSAHLDGYSIASDGSTLYVQPEIAVSNVADGHRWQIWAVDLATEQMRVIGQFDGAATSTWTPDSSQTRVLVPSDAWPSQAGGPVRTRFLVIDLGTGRVLRTLHRADRWDAGFSLFAW